MHSTWLALIFINISVFDRLHSAIIRVPSNVTYNPGGASLRLNCSSDTGVIVAWLQGGSNVFRYNITNSSYSPLFSVDRTIGYDLVAISKPSVIYCGQYSCIENNGFSPPGVSATVSVAEELTCTSTSTTADPTDAIEFLCTAQFCGTNTPTVYCQRNGSSDTVQVRTTYPTPNSVKTVLTDQANGLFHSVITCFASYSSLGSFSTVLPTIVEKALARCPQNTAALQGDSVSFRCSSSNAKALLWFNSTCNNDYNNCPANNLYNGYTVQQPASPRLNVTGDNISGVLTRDLNINPVGTSDANVYVCVEDSGGGAITAAYSALLVVLASSTTCTTNLPADSVIDEFDSLSIECNVSYNGYWTPVMRWQNDVTGQNLTSYVINTTSQLVTSRLTLTATSALNATRISCVTYFSDNPATRTVTVSATNIPTYTHKWTSSTFFVRTNSSTQSTTERATDRDSPQQGVAVGFKSATIALAAIAGVSVAVNILFLIIFYRRRRRKDLNKLSGHKTNGAVSKQNTSLDYQELNISTLSQPTVYASIPPSNP